MVAHFYLPMNIETDYYNFNKLLQPLIGEPLQVNKSYLSPIPRAGHYETTPSFRITEWNKRLTYRDWGSGDGGYPVNLAMKLFGIPYEDAEVLLEGDIPEGIEIKTKKRYKLFIEDRDTLTQSELLWWMSYGIQEDTLNLFNVRGVDTLKAGSNKIFDKGTAYLKEGTFKNKVAFSYRGGPDLSTWHFYCPDPKFFYRKGNTLFGLEQLPKVADNLVILSGAKDCMAFFEASGLPVLSGSGEACYNHLKPHIAGLRRRFRNIWTLMDPDAAGQIATLTLKKELDLPPFPFKYPDTKQDIANLSKNLGLGWLANEIKQALK